MREETFGDPPDEGPADTVDGLHQDGAHLSEPAYGCPTPTRSSSTSPSQEPPLSFLSFQSHNGNGSPTVEIMLPGDTDAQREEAESTCSTDSNMSVLTRSK
jgi:hypothetical protein